MTGKQTTVLTLGIALIALQFYAGGQWRILFGIIKKPSPKGQQGGGGNSPGPSGDCPPGFVFDPVHKVCVKKLVM